MSGAFLLAIPGLQPSPTPSATPFGTGVIGFSFLLSVMIWGPVLVALVIALVPNPRRRLDRFMMLTAFWTNIALLLLALIAYSQFSIVAGGVQFEERQPWLAAIGAGYHLGVDGISMTVLLLSCFVGVVAVVASANIRERVREYYCLLLLTEAAINGVIVARDFFVLMLFWAAAALPLALLAAGWAEQRRGAVSARFLAHWGVGSAALLAAGLMLYVASGGAGFDFDLLLKASPATRPQLAVGIAVIVAAASRLPLVPLHGWVRDLYAEAPAGPALLVAGAASRLGAYLLLRLLVQSEHDAARLLAPFLAVLGGVTVAYGALAALRRDDLRRVGAYAALIPGGITTVGVAALTPLALDGTVFGILAGGLAAALAVGACATVAARAHTRNLALLGGLGGRIPILGWLLVLAALSIVGVPGLATFTSALMVLLGSFRSQPAGAFIAAAGLVLAAVAIGALLYRVLFRAPNPDAPGASEASLGEVWYLGLLAGALIYFGVVPGGPKLAGVPLFDPGIVNVFGASAADAAAPYVPSPSPSP